MNKRVQLYYASSSKDKISNYVDYIYREFIIITGENSQFSSKSDVYVLHETSQPNKFWEEIPAKNISSFINVTEKKRYTIWHCQIKWLSLGSPYPYLHNFAIKYINLGSLLPEYDNNLFHNYNLEEGDGYYFSHLLNVKLQEASLVYDNGVTIFKGVIMIKNIDYWKTCNLEGTYIVTEGNPITNSLSDASATYQAKNNRYGIEKWIFTKQFESIVESLNFTVAVEFKDSAEQPKHWDTNFGRNYILNKTNSVIDHSNNNQ